MNSEIGYLTPYIKRFIESNIDLIESEDYRTLLKRCLPTERKNILSVLKNSGIKIPEYDLGKIFGAIIDARDVNKLIKKTLADHNITYHTAYNDKGKTGRKFKYECLNISIDQKKWLEDLIHKLLENNGIDYDYISVHENYYSRRFMMQAIFGKPSIDLVVRINADEV